MQITTAQLAQLDVPYAIRQDVVDALAKSQSVAELNTPRRVAAFLGQCLYESCGFSQLAENLNYTTPARIRAVFPSYVKTDAQAKTLVRNPSGLALAVYSNRLGNGDASTGDGYDFRGSGPIQVTGRAAFTAAEKRSGELFTTSPSYGRTVEGGTLLSACWWADNDCNALADAWNIATITRKVNGPARLGAAEREQLSVKALRVIS